MIDLTRLGGTVRPAFVGAVIDAFSRRMIVVTERDPSNGQET
jgi:hypothetical protein